MPRVRADAPDLAISLDGAWLARLDAGQLSLYDLRDSAPEALEEPVVTLEQAGSTGPGYVTFCHGDRLLCLLPFRVDEEGTDEGLVATLLEVPTLEPMSRLVVPGARRVLGIGPTGAVVAPLAAGADVISIRGADLSLDQTFLRGDVLSAVPAPERRWLIEQRGGHELWDVATRRITAHLTLATRLPLLQVGFAQGGKLIWTLAAAVPVHLEVFRFSDGRRLFELDEPGRPLRAEAGPGRLVVAHSTESGSARFLDVDLGEQTLRRLEAPAGSLLSFALRPGLCAELLALVEEGGGARLHRLPLPSVAGPAAEVPPAEASRARPVSPFLTRSGMELEPAGDRLWRSQARPLDAPAHQGRLPRRPPLRDALGEEGRPSALSRRSLSSSAEEPTEWDTGVAAKPNLPEPPPEPPPRVPRLGLARPLRRAGDAPQGPGVWHWELARWAQRLLQEEEGELLSTPPPGGALAALGTRLGLSSVAQKVVALLYALEHLTGSHPGGLPPIEIAQALGPIHDEALVLGELLPEAPLRRQGVLRRAPGGRLRLSTAATALLAGQHLPDLIPGTSPRPGGHRLEPGLYHLPQHAAPALASLVSTLSQPTLRVDALAEADVLCALRRALRSARLHAAVVLVEGLPGVAYPLFGGEMRGPLLRRLLRAPEVPLVVCGSTTALSSLGLAAQTLTAPLPRGAPAPSLPSGALPPGTFWRAPLPSARAAFLDGSSAPPGRLELFDGTDPRAAIVLTGTATPDDFARAAALAARDGAVLVLDCPLTASRSMVLAALVRQVPVTVLIAPPPEGLPSELARLSEEFARGEGLL